MTSNTDKIELYTSSERVPRLLHQYTIQKKLIKPKKYLKMELFTSFINNTVQSIIIKSKNFRDILILKTNNG